MSRRAGHREGQRFCRCHNMQASALLSRSDHFVAEDPATVHKPINIPLSQRFISQSSLIDLQHTTYHTMKTLSSLIALISSLCFSFSDTTSTEIVAPGVIYTQYTLPGPFTLDVLEVDITNPYITLETYKPSGGLTKTTVQSDANDKTGHRVIGAVNGGFFSF